MENLFLENFPTTTTTIGRTGSTGPSSPQKDQNCGGGFDVDMLCYPIDLLSSKNAYGNSYVLININIAEDSKIQDTSDSATTAMPSNQLRSDLLGQNIGDIAGVIATGGTSIAGRNVAAAIGKGVGPTGKIQALIGVAGVTAIGVTSETTSPTFTRPQKRLKTSIALSIPNDLATRYSVSWNETGTDMFAFIAGLANETGRGLLAAGQQIANGTEDSSVSMALNSESVQNIKRMGLEGLKSQALKGADAASVATGLASNPRKEQQFQGVDFRQFNFNYMFAPRSKEEAAVVNKIIYLLKYHMHPEYAGQDKFLFKYPSEFDFTYYFNGRENPNIHRQTSSVLTTMEIKYAPNDYMNFFRDGMPTMISIQLSFKELMILTKETIAKGA